MALRFYTDKVDRFGRIIEVKLYDDDFLGVSQAINMVAGSPTLTYDTKADNSPFASRIISSKLQFGIVVDTEDLETLFDDISLSKEGRFWVELYVESDLEWTGIILQDQGTIQDTYKPILDITAVCGLSLLKNIEYDYIGNLTPFATYIPYSEHFSKLLSYIKWTPDFIEYFGTGTAAMYYANTNYTNVSHNLTNRHPFRLTGVPNYFWKKEAKERVYEDAYTALEDLLKHWNAQIYQSRGYFHIISIDTRIDENGYGRVFNNSGLIDDQYDISFEYDTVACSVSDEYNSNLISGQYGFLPALRNLRYTIDAERFNFNLFENVELEGDSSGVTYTNPDEEFLFRVSDANDKRLHGRLNFTIKNVDSTPPTSDQYYRFGFKIRLDNDIQDYWLAASEDLIGNLSYNYYGDDVLTWETTTQEIIFYIPVRQSYTGFYSEYTTLFGFQSLVFPSLNIYDIYIEVDFYGVSTWDPATETFSGVSNYDTEWSLSSYDGSKLFIGDEFFEMYIDADDFPFIYENDSDNSYDYEEVTRSGDIVDISIQGQYVSDGTVATGEFLKFYRTNGRWQYNNTGTEDLKELHIMRQMVRMQSAPIKFYEGTIIQSVDLIRFTDRIQYRDEVYLPINLSINYDAASVTGRWFKLLDSTPSTFPYRRRQRKPGKTKIRDNFTLQDLGLSNAIANSGAIKHYTIIETLVDQTTLDVSSYPLSIPNTATADEIEAYTDLYVDNIRLKYYDGDPTGIQGAWSFYPNLDTITFWRSYSGKLVLKSKNLYDVEDLPTA